MRSKNQMSFIRKIRHLLITIQYKHWLKKIFKVRYIPISKLSIFRMIMDSNFKLNLLMRVKIFRVNVIDSYFKDKIIKIKRIRMKFLLINNAQTKTRKNKNYIISYKMEKAKSKLKFCQVFIAIRNKFLKRKDRTFWRRLP